MQANKLKFAISGKAGINMPFVLTRLKKFITIYNSNIFSPMHPIETEAWMNTRKIFSFILFNEL